MANPALDQFSRALFWQVVPIIILCGAGGLFLKQLVQWLERKAIRFGQGLKQRRLESNGANTAVDAETPHCPACNSLMVKRTARRGANSGSKFWGCPKYPGCRGTRRI